MVTLPSLVPFRPWPSHGSWRSGSSNVALRPLQTEFLISGTECVYHCRKHVSDLCGDLALDWRIVGWRRQAFPVTQKVIVEVIESHICKQETMIKSWLKKSILWFSVLVSFLWISSCFMIRNIWISPFLSFPEIYLTDTVDHFILQCRSEDTVTPMKMSQAFPLYTSGKIVWLQFHSLVLPEIPSSGKSEAESWFEFLSLFILIPTWNAKYISSSVKVFNQTQAVSQTTGDDTERVKSHVSRWRLTQLVCFWSEIIRNAYLFYSLLTLLSQIHELASFLDHLKLFLQT